MFAATVGPVPVTFTVQVVEFIEFVLKLSTRTGVAARAGDVKTPDKPIRTIRIVRTKGAEIGRKRICFPVKTQRSAN